MPSAKAAKSNGEKPKTNGEKPAKRARKRKAPSEAVGLTALECAAHKSPPHMEELCTLIEKADGAVLSTYREPLGGHWVALAALPLDRVKPTPFQRGLSKAHADKLVSVMPKVGRFLDPIIAVHEDGLFITPNGMHRLTAMRALGAKAITTLVVPEREIAFRILALNTEKAHNLRDKALEVVRMMRALVEEDGKKHETEFSVEFEEPAFLTLGLCYEKNGRFSGGVYFPVVSRCDAFRDEPLSQTLLAREREAEKLLALDELVNEAVQRLKEVGFTSGYLKPVVVARINPLRFIKAKPNEPARADFDKTIARMMEGARKFDPSKVKASDVALAASMGVSDEASV